LVVGSSLILFFISPAAKKVDQFFKAVSNNKNPGLWLLTCSLVISWIFAKSITNAANLGLKYGIVGGVAYATYYFSFLFAGVVIYQLRVKGKFESIHDFLRIRFGKSSIVIFSILIAFRLFNEVWSNTMVIGSYFGPAGSGAFYWSILVFTLLTLAYALKGGLSSSLLTDAVQMVLFGLLLIVILTYIIPLSNGIAPVISSGEWSLAGGVDLLFVALIQAFSYPFHDPVMTDRGFITDPKTTRKAFLIAVPLGFICIVLFSFIGVYASKQGLNGQAAVEVSKLLGISLMLVINFIMITSASSTLDSTFASFSKLTILDLKIMPVTVINGRLMMILIIILGTVPIFFGPEILSATTISGTMVIGLAPVFLFWKREKGRYSFLFSVLTGVFFGIWFTSGMFPTSLTFFNTDYGSLLSVNIIGTIACFIMYFVGGLIK